MLDFVPLFGDTSITAAHTSQGSRWCPGWAARREDWRLRPGPRPHTYPGSRGRIIATLISASRHSVPTPCHTYTIISIRKNAFYPKFCNIHSHGTMRLRHFMFRLLLTVTSSAIEGLDEVNRSNRASSQSSTENIEVLCSEWAVQLLILQIIWSCSLLNFNIIKIENHWKWTNKNPHSTCWITCSFILAFQTFL